MNTYYYNTKYYIIYILSILSLSIMFAGCSSMLTISTAAFITTTWYDSRTIGSQLDDNVLKIQIYYALNKHESIKKFTRIKNTVYQGHVLLTGQSPSPSLSQEAIKIVKNISGVKKIHNAIRHAQPIPLYSILFDCLISNQIRLNLLTQKNIHISNIKVISENTEVFLLGQVTYEEGLYAEKIASNINGVKTVSNVFIYI